MEVSAAYGAVEAESKTADHEGPHSAVTNGTHQIKTASGLCRNKHDLFGCNLKSDSISRHAVPAHYEKPPATQVMASRRRLLHRKVLGATSREQSSQNRSQILLTIHTGPPISASRDDERDAVLLSDDTQQSQASRVTVRRGV